MKATLQLLERHLGAFFLAYGLLLLAVAIWSPITGDYCPYVQQWHITYHGLDPWANTVDRKDLIDIPWFNFCGKHSFARNAYGPLFNVYGVTSIIFPTIPRAIGAVLFLIITWKIIDEIRAYEQMDWRVRFWLYAGIFGNFFAFVLVGITGGNDVYMAFVICAAMIALRRGNSALAGITIGLGALIKFYPLYLLPFMALDRRHLNVKFATVAVATFVAGAILAYAVWGAAIFEPLLFNLGREASRSSIEYIVLGALQSWFHVTIPGSWAVIGVMFLAAAALVYQYVMGFSRSMGLMIALILILTFNQVGYVVYYFPLMIAIYLYYLYERPPYPLARALLILFSAILFRSLFYPFEAISSIYGLNSIYIPARLAATVVASLINVYVLAELILHARRAAQGYTTEFSG